MRGHACRHVDVSRPAAAGARLERCRAPPRIPGGQHPRRLRLHPSRPLVLTTHRYPYGASTARPDAREAPPVSDRCADTSGCPRSALIDGLNSSRFLLASQILEGVGRRALLLIHESSGSFAPRGPMRLAFNLGLKLRTLADRAISGVAANRSIDESVLHLGCGRPE